MSRIAAKIKGFVQKYLPKEKVKKDSIQKGKRMADIGKMGKLSNIECPKKHIFHKGNRKK